MALIVRYSHYIAIMDVNRLSVMSNLYAKMSSSDSSAKLNCKSKFPISTLLYEAWAHFFQGNRSVLFRAGSVRNRPTLTTITRVLVYFRTKISVADLKMRENIDWPLDQVTLTLTLTSTLTTNPT